MSNYHFETLQLHVGQEQADPATDSRAVPIYATTSYVFHNAQHAADRFALRDAGNIYGRLTNSTQDVFEKRIAALEGGVAGLAVASGAAAITYTIEALAQQGDHIVCQKTVYGGTYNLLAHTLKAFGVTTTFVNAHDLSEVEAAIQPNTKAIYLETLGNPNSDIPDIDAISAIAHKHNLPVVVDNTFGTPYLIRPIAHGADIVVHSATKFIGGHGTTLGGVIVDAGKFDWRASGKFGLIADPNPSYHGVSFVDAAGPAAFATYVRAILLRDQGAAISPFAAFLLLQGTETLSLRLERHAENTKKVVEFLKNHPKVQKVNHPSLPDHPDHALYERYFPNGGASIFTFEIKGGQEAAFRFIDNLEIFSLLANVADVKSLVIHPATTTHAQLTEEELLDVLADDIVVTPAFCRISRMIRDFSSDDIMVGNKKPNLRQLVENRLAARGDGATVREIRYREISTAGADLDELSLDEEVAYETPVTYERFLQWVTPQGKIAGFLRLSLPDHSFVAVHADELPTMSDEAMIREVHVYGMAARVGDQGQAPQHHGLGRLLVERACEIARDAGYARINVISAIGTREYYRHLGFYDHGLYLQKEL